MVFTRLISATLAISGLTGALAESVETNAYSPDAPMVLTAIPERSGDERRRMEPGELDFTYDLTDEEKQMFVDRHNYWRNRAALGELTGGKKAKQMPQMYWDEELAEHAKKFSRQCIWEHSMHLGWREVDYGYGENLFATSGSHGYIQNSMDNWAAEHQLYDHDTRECSGVCGHYTAMVWEHTTRVGCAVAKCNSVTGISWGQTHYVICQYYRGGNYAGEAPYQFSPTTGDGCSDAPYGESTGMSSQWNGLCNNENDICTERNRCNAMQTCTSLLPLNGVDTDYYCSAPACHYDEIPGYQIDNPYNWGNGMSENGSWKYLQNRQQCEDWCYLNKDASPGCVGCTQMYNAHSSLHFPVTTVDESERSARTHQDGSEMILLVLDCSAPGVEPTHRPTMPPVPTPAPTESPTEPSGDYTCTSRAVSDVEVEYPYTSSNGLTENGSWKWCRSSNLDECIEWCKANRYTAPCAGVTSNMGRNPGYYFPVSTVEASDRIEQSGGTLYVMDCTSTGVAPTLEPTDEPTFEPTEEPTFEPTEEPTFEPTEEPTSEPTEEPTSEPTEEPTFEPTEEPTFEPTEEPTFEPTEEPTFEPTEEPTSEPTEEPTAKPTSKPTSEPTEEPTFEPTEEPTFEPTEEPTFRPTEEPTSEPTKAPTDEPTKAPTDEPTFEPTESPTESPTLNPVEATHMPTPPPTPQPSAQPTELPTAQPTEVPSAQPTEVPTAQPTEVPTAQPTEVPSAQPTEVPSAQPTEVPTAQPTEVPTSKPTPQPTAQPSEVPTAQPTQVPTAQPTEVPTGQPTQVPSAQPTELPTSQPTELETAQPTYQPTAQPTEVQTAQPTAEPTWAPVTSQPTAEPTQMPTCEPTVEEVATAAPTYSPTEQPADDPTSPPSDDDEACVTGSLYEAYAQCGGDDFTPASGNCQACPSGYQCFKRSQWYSNCNTACPTGLGWDCEADGNPAPTPQPTEATPADGSCPNKEHDTCGGVGNEHYPSCCPTGLTCHAYSKWHSQCVKDE